LTWESNFVALDLGFLSTRVSRTQRGCVAGGWEAAASSGSSSLEARHAGKTQRELLVCWILPKCSRIRSLNSGNAASSTMNLWLMWQQAMHW